MGEIVNLRMARKRKAREEASRVAEQNRITYGRGKEERKWSEAERALAAKKLEAHKRETKTE